MSWFASKKSSKGGKKRHIQSLMGNNGRIYSVIQSNSNSYTVFFKTRIGEYSFTIQLPDTFPDSAPQIFTETKYSHPWLDANGYVIGIQELNQWSSSHSDLGRITSAIVMQFTASPPSIKQQASSQSSSYQPIQPLPVKKMESPPSYQSHVHKQQSTVFDLQTVKYAVPPKIEKLDELSKNEIDEMVDEPAAIEAFAYSVCSGLREMRQSQQKEVLRIARLNLAKKEEIMSTDKEIQALREEIDTLNAYYVGLKERQSKQMQKFSKQRLNQELDKKIDEYDQNCNEIKDKLDEGQLAPIAFVKQYVKQRQVYHLLQIKKEKLNLFG